MQQGDHDFDRLCAAAEADIDIVESKWGCIVDVYVNPHDLAELDRFIAQFRPGTPRDVVIAQLLRAIMRAGVRNDFREIKDLAFLHSSAC